MIAQLAQGKNEMSTTEEWINQNEKLCDIRPIVATQINLRNI